MATIVNVHEAKTHLSRLLARVERGEEVVIARSGRPIARLERITSTRERRTPGRDKGSIVIGPDFDAPLPELEPGYFHDEDPLRPVGR